MPSTAITTIPYPMTNGVRQAWCSLELKVRGVPYLGITSLNYSWEIKRDNVYGTHPDPLGITRGQATYTADIEMLLAEYNFLITQLGNGFAEVPLDIFATYSENGLDTICDQVLGCLMDKGEASQAVDSKALVRKVTLHPIKVKPNGLDIFKIPLVGVAQ